MKKDNYLDSNRTYYTSKTRLAFAHSPKSIPICSCIEKGVQSGESMKSLNGRDSG